MADLLKPMKPRSMAAVGGGGLAVLFLALQFYTVPSCGCLSTAQVMLGMKWYELDPASLQERGEKLYPKGLSEAALRKHRGEMFYDKFCVRGGSAREVVCEFPHDQNGWRTTAAEVRFALDEGGRLVSTTVVRKSVRKWL